jgi:hypothetical protein
MHIHLFGSTTPVGEAFRRLLLTACPEYVLISYSHQVDSAYHADFRSPCSFRLGGELGAPSLWISFGPIWLFSSFLESLANDSPSQIYGLRGVIACSSSSVITKRFASNSYDRDLVSRLIAAEDRLLAICRQFNLSCKIIRPTIVYGKVGPYVDRNLSLLLMLMRRFPLLPLPLDTGLRQPIHATQLAAVALSLVRHCSSGIQDPTSPHHIVVGGDIELSYTTMLRALQHSLPPSDPGHRCRLLPVPNRLFYSLASPLLLFSPKAFEALLRISADLSGFTPSSQLLSISPQNFPLADSQ